MKRISTATSVANKHGEGKAGFSNGVTGLQAATALNAEWFDHVQEELSTFIEAEGIELDSASYTQLHQALIAAFARIGASSYDEEKAYAAATIGRIIQRCVLQSQSARDNLGGKPYLLVISGQSNAAGANSGGSNPANTLVKTWDGETGSWGGSDYTALPWTRSNPHGNTGNNNIGLALAHRIADETGRPVYIVFDAQGGRPIADWVGSGTASERYAALKVKIEAALASPELEDISKVDAVLFQQGEADYLRSFDEYLADLQTLIAQWRAESWCQKTTPILLGEPSDLHDRYEPKKAIRYLGGGIDPWVISINSKGLDTSDQTHYVGADLWEFGYHRYYRALQLLPRSWHVPRTLWRNRDAIANSMPGADPKYGETVIYSPSSLALSGADRTPNYSGTIACGPSVSQGSSNGIAVGSGLTVTASGSATFGVGSAVSDVNCVVGGYGHTVAGRNSLVAGYQNTIQAAAQYAAALGRGHTLADPYTVAIGGFTEFTTALADPAVLQVGVSVSAATPKNGLTVFRSGRSMLGGLLDFKTDNAYSLGSPSYRASVVYAGTSTINTSDGRLKRKRGGLSDAELRAWEKVQPCVYQMLDAIEEKGEDGARLHAGLIAQEVMAAFESEGLDPKRYALFCEDEIFEDVTEYVAQPVERQKMTTLMVKEIDIVDGRPVQVRREVMVPEFVEDEVVDESGELVLDNEGEPLKYRMPVTEIVDETVAVPVRRSLGTRYGLRYTECLIFEMAYQRAVIANLQNRLSVIEP